MSIFSAAHLKFLSILIQHRVDFILLGGYAAILHGANRTTSDIDLLIKPSKENGQKVIDSFVAHNLEADDLHPEDFEKELFLSFGFEPDAVDIMTFTKGITFDEVFANAKEINIEGHFLKMIDIRDLIRNKEHLHRTGNKALLDQYDIQELKRILIEHEGGSFPG